MDKCTVGILAHVECHITWHTTSTKLVALKSVDHMEEILWRVVSEVLNLIKKQLRFVLIICMCLKNIIPQNMLLVTTNLDLTKKS